MGEGDNKFVHVKLVVVFIADASPKREDTYMVVAFMDHREPLLEGGMEDMICIVFGVNASAPAAPI